MYRNPSFLVMKTHSVSTTQLEKQTLTKTSLYCKFCFAGNISICKYLVYSFYSDAYQYAHNETLLTIHEYVWIPSNNHNQTQAHKRGKFTTHESGSLPTTLIFTLDVVIYSNLCYNNRYGDKQIILFARGIELLISWTPHQTSKWYLNANKWRKAHIHTWCFRFIWNTVAIT
jgi:hypothetical protein